MLERDNYRQDYALKYFPDYSVAKYVEYIQGIVPFYSLYFDPIQRTRWQSSKQIINNLIAATFLVGFLPVIFHKKLPLLKRTKGRIGRILWGLGFLFILPNIVGGILGKSKEGQIMASYQANLLDFKKYRENKDLTTVNQNIRFYDI